MTFKRFLLGIITIFYASAHAQHPGFHITSVFTHQPEAIASFMDNVRRQHPSEKIIKIVNEIQDTQENELDDAHLYKKLCTKLIPLRSRLDILKIIRLIQFQKNTLKDQITTLLGKTRVIHNCLEIGTPGTYASTIKDSIKGSLCVA